MAQQGKLEYSTITVPAPASGSPDRLTRILDTGMPYYAVVVEALGVTPVALRFGDPSRDFIRVQAGDTFNFGTTPQNGGLWAFWPRVSYDARFVVTVFFEPVADIRLARREIWDLASRHGSSLVVAAAAGQRAGVALVNYLPIDYGVFFGGDPGPISPRLVRLDDLYFWSNIPTTIRIAPCSASAIFPNPPAQQGPPHNFPVQLGVDPGPVRFIGGVDPAPGAIGAALIQPIPVAALEKVSIADMVADIESGSGIVVRLEDFAGTLTCNVRWRNHILDYAKG